MMEQKFEEILRLESRVRLEKASEAMGWSLDDRARGKANRIVAQQRLFAAVDALTAEERVTFGIYRKQVAA